MKLLIRPSLSTEPMRRLLLLVLGSMTVIAACARSQEYNVMHMEAACDSVPPPLRPGEQIGGTLPAARQPGLDSVLVIGTLVEAKSGRPLLGGSISLHDSSEPINQNRPTAGAQVNGAAGFELVAPKPGRYSLIARRIGYSPTTLSVSLRAGIVDTVRAELRYYHCLGY